MNIKKCSKCKKNRHLSEFHKDSKTKDGYKYYCKECRRKEPEEYPGIKEYQKKYWKDHPEQRKAISNNYYLRNREVILEKTKKYNGQRRIYNKWYKKTASGKYYNLMRHNRKRGFENTMTLDEFTQWFQDTPQECAYCQIPPENLKDVDYISSQYKGSLTIDRKDNDKGYQINNIVLACSACNMIKSNILSYDDMKEIALKYIKPKWDKIINKKIE